MIVNIVCNNLDIIFSFVNQNDVNIKSFIVPIGFEKNIDSYFSEIDQNIKNLRIDIRSIIYVICCIEDKKIKDVMLMYFEKIKIFPFFVEKEHLSKILPDDISVPLNIALNAFGVCKEYKDQYIISILFEKMISVSFIKNGIFKGYSMFPNFTLTNKSLVNIKNIPDFITSIEIESLNRDLYSAISHGTFTSIIGAVKFHINDIIVNQKLKAKDVQVVASGHNLFEIPNFIEEIKDVRNNFFEVGLLAVIRDHSNFY